MTDSPTTDAPAACAPVAKTATAKNEAFSEPRRLKAAVRSIFGVTAIGSLLLWFAQPPLAWGWLAWAAPAPWLLVAARHQKLRRRDYAQLWLAGVLYWLLAVHWVRLPHPLTPIGWVCLAMYLGCYLPTFVWLTRVATRQTPTPLWLAAPIAWAGLEFLQAHLFSGFLMGALSHTQAFYPGVIQIADTVGAYGVSFVMMLCTGAVVSWVDHLILSAKLPTNRDPVRPSRSALATQNQRRVLGAAVAVGCLMLVVLHGRQAVAPTDDARQPITVALIQGNTLADIWNADFDFDARNREIMDRQAALTLQAAQQAEADGKTIDLFVWPESMFRPPIDFIEGGFRTPLGMPEGLAAQQAEARHALRELTKTAGSAVLTGGDRYDWAPDKTDPSFLRATPYNTALLINRRGELKATYDKTHRVPFGEYIPLASNLPALYFMTPMQSGLRPGEGPVVMELKTADADQGSSIDEAATNPSTPPAPRAPILLAPNICYETVIPHVIHGHVRELTNAGTPPDLLVNLTNNAWFWGSSELDMHLACNVLRAVETRTPMVIAANGGLSAVINASGRVLAKSRRQEEQALVADAPLRRRGAPSLYVRYGDWFAGGCLILCGLVAMIGLRKTKVKRQNAESS